MARPTMRCEKSPNAPSVVPSVESLDWFESRVLLRPRFAVRVVSRLPFPFPVALGGHLPFLLASCHPILPRLRARGGYGRMCFRSPRTPAPC